MKLEPDKNAPPGEAQKTVVALALLGLVCVTGLLLAWVYLLAPASLENATAPDHVGPGPQSKSDQLAASAVSTLIKAITAHDERRVRDALTTFDPGDLNRPIGGMTPLMSAAALGNLNIVTLLLHSGADPNQRGSSQRTALQYAAESNHIKTAALLLDAGADIDGYDNTRLTPLIMAADRNYTELAVLLIERGADANLAHVQGWTALIDAARNGNQSLVKLLLEHGADRHAQLPDGSTAYDIAIQRNFESVARLLQQ